MKDKCATQIIELNSNAVSIGLNTQWVLVFPKVCFKKPQCHRKLRTDTFKPEQVSSEDPRINKVSYI